MNSAAVVTKNNTIFVNKNINYLTPNITELHEKALLIVQKYHQAECALIDILQKLDQEKVYIHMGYSSLFDYAIKALKLSEACAYNFIAVMRKAKIIPELKLAIEQGELSVSKARKITPVITRENSPKWIELAQTLPKNKLEQAVAKEVPKTLTPERAKYVTEDRLELKLGVSEEIMKKLKRVQDIISQKTKQAASYENTLDAVLSFYLEKLDPLEKAKRNLNKNINSMKTINVTEVGNIKIDNTEAINTFKDLDKHNLPVPGQVLGAVVSSTAETQTKIATKTAILKLCKPTYRQAIPAQTKHQIMLRDQGRCTFVNTNGDRCENKRWLEVHHKVPVAKNGTNNMQNLTTLCFQHHRLLHKIHTR